jgi:NAD(P)-dependent dehydrogenase (short-subunit alcohol dehydrogenase family)
VQRILGDREIRATLAAIRAVGGRVEYHACDVRTPAFADVIAAIYARHGRLDGVIHGAGVVEDKLVRHKSPASFERVVATKLAGARTLADALRPDVGFVAFFASVSGVFGNRGQTDYAAANVPMLPVVAGLRNTRLQILLYSVSVVVAAILPFALGLTGLIYGVAAAVLNTVFIILAAAVFANRAEEPAGMKPERRLFAFSILYLFGLFAALVVDRWVIA